MECFQNSFYSVPMPNTSYVRSWKFSCENIQSVVEKFMQGDKERYTEDRDSSYPDEYKFELIYDKNSWDGGILSYFNCIRFYYNERTKICFVTPYVFLKTMSESEIVEICAYKIIKEIRENKLNCKRDGDNRSHSCPLEVDFTCWL